MTMVILFSLHFSLMFCEIGTLEHTCYVHRKQGLSLLVSDLTCKITAVLIDCYLFKIAWDTLVLRNKLARLTQMDFVSVYKLAKIKVFGVLPAH